MLIRNYWVHFNFQIDYGTRSLFGIDADQPANTLGACNNIINTLSSSCFMLVKSAAIIFKR